MSTWFSIELGDGVQAYEPSTKILEEFMPAYIAAGQPYDLAVFSKYDLSKNMVTVYFTPAAEDMANSFGATACDKPTIEKLSLLAGDQRALGIHFPETHAN